MLEPLPAISLVAVPGRRRQTLDIARDIERRGFSGIYMPSRWSNMGQCTGLAFATEQIRFGTAIAPIYAQTAEEFAIARPTFTKFRVGGFALASASRTGRCISASASPSASRSRTPAPLSKR